MATMGMLWTLLMTLATAGAPRADVHTEAIDYKDGDVVLSGWLAHETGLKEKRPGVIIVHEWKGHGDYVRRRAEQIAGLGYVAFAVDMYGKGVFAKDHIEAGKLSGALSGDRAAMRRRARAGYDVLAHHPLVDSSRMAAMGYCFGGTTSLEMARASFDLKGVASFHGSLGTPSPAEPGALKARVIVFHGADDPHASKQVTAFQDEMRTAKADWQFVSFGGALHSFTVKEAKDPEHGMAYDQKADQRSWGMLRLFLEECFQKS